MAHCVPKEDKQDGNSVRPRLTRPGSGDHNDDSDDSNFSENSFIDALYPSGNAPYNSKPSDSKEPIDVSLDTKFPHHTAVMTYKTLYMRLPRCTVRSNIEGYSILVLDDVKNCDRVIEYTAHRISRRKWQRMDWNIDYHDIYPDVLGSVALENAMIDPEELALLLTKSITISSRMSSSRSWGPGRDVWNTPLFYS